MLAAASVLATTTASAKPAQAAGDRQARIHHEVPRRLLLHARRRRRRSGRRHTRRQVIYAQGKAATDDAGEIAAIQNMVAQRRQGDRHHADEPGGVPALNKAVKAGVKVVLMDNDLPTWKKKTSVVATNNLQGRPARRQVPRHASSRPATRSASSRAIPASRRSTSASRACSRASARSRSKIKVVSKLETDCDQTKGATAAQTILTANPELTAIYSACGPPALGAIQSIKNAGIKPGGIILVGFDALARRGDGDQGRHRDGERRAVPGEDRLARHRHALRRRCRARRCRRTSTPARRSSRRRTRPSSRHCACGDRPGAAASGAGAAQAPSDRRDSETVIVDAHQHFWNLEREPMPWMTDEHARHPAHVRAADLEPLLASAGVSRDGARAGRLQRRRHRLDVRARGAARLDRRRHRVGRPALARAHARAARRARRRSPSCAASATSSTTSRIRTGSCATTCSRASRCSRSAADPRAAVRLPAPPRRRAGACGTLPGTDDRDRPSGEAAARHRRDGGVGRRAARRGGARQRRRQDLGPQHDARGRRLGRRRPARGRSRSRSTPSAPNASCAAATGPSRC